MKELGLCERSWNPKYYIRSNINTTIIKGFGFCPQKPAVVVNVRRSFFGYNVGVRFLRVVVEYPKYHNSCCAGTGGDNDEGYFGSSWYPNYDNKLQQWDIFMS